MTDRCRVLLCEENRVLRSIASRRLHQEGYEVAVAENGRVGLEIHRSFQPEVIISSWAVPEVDGLALCKAIKSHPGSTGCYFILLTPRERRAEAIQKLYDGVDEYLIKPYDEEELLARLRAAERIVRLRKEIVRANDRLRDALERIHSELEAVAEIQKSLLPEVCPKLKGLEALAYYMPSEECGGDYYDLLQTSPTLHTVIVADVSGHGTPAMVAMVLTRALIHGWIRDFKSPAQALEHLNKLLYEHLPTEQYLTLFHGIFDQETGEFTYASAGHCPPLLRRVSGDVEPLPGCEGFPLKLVGQDVTYSDKQISVSPGDKMLIYTDGLIEACNAGNIQFGQERLAEILRRYGGAPNEVLQSEIIHALQSFTNNGPLKDDMTFVILEFTELGDHGLDAPLASEEIMDGEEAPDQQNQECPTG